MNSRIRKIIKTCGHFPSEEAAANLFWLALRNIADKRVRRSFVASDDRRRGKVYATPHTQKS